MTSSLKSLLQYPFDAELLARKRRSIKRQLLEQGPFQGVRIAVLGGSTTGEIREMLELFLLNEGLQPEFYESEYGLYYEESVFENQRLKDFAPGFIYLHTSIDNLMAWPQVGDTPEDVERKVDAEYAKLEAVWKHLIQKYSPIVIQNSFTLPEYRYLGNRDAVDDLGGCRFIARLNQRIMDFVASEPRMRLNDVGYLSARVGLERWYDRDLWYLYRFAFSDEAMLLLAYNLARIVAAEMGKSKKCLVLDLDNTLWGGVIGDDGVENIKLGPGTPEGEAYLEFQRYVLRLKQRGVILAVCSKNDEQWAMAGLAHPDSVLSRQDFAAFAVNWNPKHLNIAALAKELNIGLDSLVFIDDNPAERQIVRQNLPEVAVPEVEGGNVASYLRAIDEAGYFEPTLLSEDDLKRARNYAENAKRRDAEDGFMDYDEFLKSLEMRAEIRSFSPIYVDRITQLTNKSNQFNLTTRRYTTAEIGEIAQDSTCLTLYGKLADRFGDNGLVSVIIGRVHGETLHIELWLMSCRVLRRTMENAMFAVLVSECRKRGIREIVGYYYKTAKNGMVSELYGTLGFSLIDKRGDDTVWRLDLEKGLETVGKHFISLESLE